MDSTIVTSEFISTRNSVKYEEIRVYDLPGEKQKMKVTIISDFYVHQCAAYVSIWTMHGWKTLYQKSVHDTFLADSSNRIAKPEGERRDNFCNEAGTMFATARKIMS